MSSVNKVFLVGKLGKDPELKQLENGSVCNFSIATSEKFTDKNTGEKKENTEWHSIVAYSKVADICGQYLKKGSQVHIEGKIKSRKWQDKASGETKSATDIICNQMTMLGSKSDSSVPAPTSMQGEAKGASKREYAQAAQGGWDGVPEDDIPF